MTHGEPRRPWVRRACWIGVATVAFLYLLLTVSSVVLPRLESPCGRLTHVPPGLDSLATNHVRLDTRTARAWRQLDLAYRVEPNEALGFVLDRVGNDYVLLRISRLAALESGWFVYRDHAIVERHPVSDFPVPSGRLELERVGERIAVAFDAGPRLGIDSPRVDGAFEAVMFPPSSPDLHRRVTLGDVMLDGGVALRAFAGFERITSPATLAVVALLLVAAGRRVLRAAARRSLRYQAEHEPLAIALVLGSLALLFAGLSQVPRVELLMSFTDEERRVFRAFTTVIVLLSWAFLMLRDRVLRRFARWRGRGPLRPFAAPLLHVLFIVVCVVLLAVLFDRIQIRVEPRDELARPSAERAPRIACLGGSSTRGYPFPERWGAAYPMVLEKQLRARGRDAIVWNLGVESATLDYLMERFDRWLTPLAPTHLVLNNVANNAFGDPGPFRDGLDRLVRMARARGLDVILVKEPMLEVVYHAGRWASVGPFYPILDEVAAQDGAVVLDPVPRMVELRDELLFMDDVHLTPQGHRRMAEALLSVLAPAGPS